MAKIVPAARWRSTAVSQTLRRRWAARKPQFSQGNMVKFRSSPLLKQRPLSRPVWGVGAFLLGCCMTKTEPAPPLNLINALIAGFEVVTAQPLWAVGPLALDLWLWWGPHFSIEPLVREIVATFQTLLSRSALEPEALRVWQPILAEMLTYGEQFNVFAALSTAPLGIPSLLAGRRPTLSPFGSPTVWPISDPLVYLGLTVLFAVVGVWLVAAYWGGVAAQVRATPSSVGAWFAQVWGDWLQLLIGGVAFGLLLFGLSLPIQLLTFFLQASPLLSALVWVLGFSMLLWLVFYVSLTPHGIILHRRNLFYALGDSLRLVQNNTSRVTGLWLVILVLNLGLSWLWNVPPDESWLLLLGISGHAVVVTALTAASFYLYQDCYRRWQEEKAGTKGTPGK